jgi:hypothetical protein
LIHGDYSIGITGVLFDNFFALCSQNKFQFEFYKKDFSGKKTQKSTHLEENKFEVAKFGFVS